MLAGDPYRPMDPELVQARARARRLCEKLNATLETLEPGNQAQRERRRIAEELFATGGDSVWLQPPFSTATTDSTSSSVRGCISISTASLWTCAECGSET